MKVARAIPYASTALAGGITVYLVQVFERLDHKSRWEFVAFIVLLQVLTLITTYVNHRINTPDTAPKKEKTLSGMKPITDDNNQPTEKWDEWK